MNKSEQDRCHAHTHHAHKAVHGHLNTLVLDDGEDNPQNTLNTTHCSEEAMKKVGQMKKKDCLKKLLLDHLQLRVFSSLASVGD
jgi:methyltransferase-like protein